MLYLLYFIVVASALLLCKVIYNIFPMFGMICTALVLGLFVWLAFTTRRNDRYIGMDPNRSIKEQENERMQKRLEEANKPCDEGKEG